MTPRIQLEDMCRQVIRVLIEALPKQVAITVILCDFGHRGNLAYMSNGVREDMIATLKEMIAKLEGRAPEGGGRA